MAGRKENNIWKFYIKTTIPTRTGCRAICKNCKMELQGIPQRLKAHHETCKQPLDQVQIDQTGLLINSVWTENTLNSTTSDDDDSYYPPEGWSDIFDWKLLKVMADKSSNILVSPISLKLVLAILYEGSSGLTQREFESGLQFHTKAGLLTQLKKTLASLHVNSASENQVRIGTRLFLDSEIKPKEKYSKNIKEYYGADVVAANFSNTQKTSSEINQWVDQITMGSLPQLTDSDVLKDMIMLIANAVYFKGVWRHQFPKNETCVRPFYVKPDTISYLPFMTTTGEFYYLELEDLDAKILRLPYKNSEYSMFIILPLSMRGLSSLIQNINLYELHRQLHYMSKRTVQVSIPKFLFRFKASYTNILQQFGLHTIFQNTASFSGIVQGNSSLLRQLVVSDIIQSTGIETDEEGSIAYAATDVIIGNKINVPDNVFNVTHPFLFFIQEEVNGTIIFIGKVENPLQQTGEIRKEKDDIAKEFTTNEKDG